MCSLVLRHYGPDILGAPARNGAPNVCLLVTLCDIDGLEIPQRSNPSCAISFVRKHGRY